MPLAVVDTSALAALVFGESEAESVANRMTGFTLMAPSLLWYELASVCLKKIKRYPEQTDVILNVFQMADNLQIELVDVDHTAVVTIAREIGLTSYDAAYLWLSRECGGFLITLDHQLQKHAQ
jgi:predicted nucleic acid-binding protein